VVRLRAGRSRRLAPRASVERGYPGRPSLARRATDRHLSGRIRSAACPLKASSDPALSGKEFRLELRGSLGVCVELDKYVMLVLGYPKLQLPMWHKYRVELYPHYGQLCGIRDRAILLEDHRPLPFRLLHEVTLFAQPLQLPAVLEITDPLRRNGYAWGTANAR
jgi:hypothetical protein